MTQLFEKIAKESQDALATRDPKRFAQCLRWLRDMANSTAEQLDQSSQRKEIKSLTDNLDLVETSMLIDALSRRNKGLVVAELRDVRPGVEKFLVSYSGGYSQAYGISMRTVTHLETNVSDETPDEQTEEETA